MLVSIFPLMSPARDRTLILGFGGNAWNAQDVAEYLHELFPTKRSSHFTIGVTRRRRDRHRREALITDAPLIYDKAVETVKPKQVVAVGFSIGSGIAATLSRMPQGRRANPGYAVQFAEGGRSGHVSVASNRPIFRP